MPILYPGKIRKPIDSYRENLTLRNLKSLLIFHEKMAAFYFIIYVLVKNRNF